MFAVTESMKETERDTKQKRQKDWVNEHTISFEDRLKLIQEKFERARAYSKALKQREDFQLEVR